MGDNDKLECLRELQKVLSEKFDLEIQLSSMKASRMSPTR